MLRKSGRLLRALMWTVPVGVASAAEQQSISITFRPGLLLVPVVAFLAVLIFRRWRVWRRTVEESRVPLDPEIFFDLGVVFPDGRHEIFSLNRELMTVGYEDACDVVVPRGRYFRPHSAESFRLERRDQEVIFHSDKPVLVNGVAVRNTRLKADDRIVFGSYRFSYNGLREVEPFQPEPPAPKFAYLGIPMAAGVALGVVFAAPVSVSLPLPQSQLRDQPVSKPVSRESETAESETADILTGPAVPAESAVSESESTEAVLDPAISVPTRTVSIPEDLAEWRILDRTEAAAPEPRRDDRYETRKLGVLVLPETATDSDADRSLPERTVNIPGRYTEWRIEDGRTYPSPPEMAEDDAEDDVDMPVPGPSGVAVAAAEELDIDPSSTGDTSTTSATTVRSVSIDDIQKDTTSIDPAADSDLDPAAAGVELVSAETVHEAAAHENPDVSLFELDQFVSRPLLSRYVVDEAEPLRVFSPGDLPVDVEVDILCIHAHPDDEAIDFGALIAAASRKGLRVGVVLFTDGESGLDIYPERYTDSEYPDREMTGSELARVRVEETRRSLSVLGADVYVRLGLANNPYNGIADELTVDAVADMWGGKEYLVTLLRDLIHRVRPEIVVSPDGPSAALEHFEHETVGRLVTATLQKMGADGDPYSPRGHLVSVDPSQSWAYSDTVGLERSLQALRGPFSFKEIQSAALEQHISQRDASVIGIQKVSTFSRELYEIRRWELPVHFSAYFTGDNSDDSGDDDSSGALVKNREEEI